MASSERESPGARSGHVDTRVNGSLSFEPPEASVSSAGPNAAAERRPGPVGSSRPAIETPIHVSRTASDVNAFPIHASKVQRPPLRDHTLARDRLLDWLSAKIHHRLVLVTAEAGYGKTTLLADFSGRTRLPTLWYRLDEGDRDWVTILNYLVAAGRELDPDFAPTTWSMLGELGTSGSSKDAVLASFLRELQPLGERGAVWVFDDYHAVEDVPDVEQIVREIVVR